MLDRFYRSIPLVAAFFWLAVLYGWQTRGHVTPWLFTDELKYTHYARSIAAHGVASERHHSASFDSLYTYFIAPFWWIHNVHTAYASIKYAGALAMTATIFPTYFFARLVVSRNWALFAAIATVACPALAYGSFMIEEPIAHPGAPTPFFLIAKSPGARPPARPPAPGSSRRAQPFAGGRGGGPPPAVIVTLFATFVRGQLAILIVVYVIAVVLLLWTSEKGRQWRSRWSTWDWVGFFVL